MPNANGIVAFIGNRDVRFFAEKALRSMAHRATKGYWLRVERHKLVIGGCIIRPTAVRNNTLLHGMIYHPKSFDFSQTVDRRTSNNDLQGLASELANADGAYAFLHLSNDGLILGRDPLGVKPLYIARGRQVTGVASEAKALISVGLKEVERVEPGWIYTIYPTYDENKISKYEIKTWRNLGQLQVGFDEASNEVLSLLIDSLRSRVYGRKRVCVGFSGGLDSSILALIASRLVDVDLVTICTDDSNDKLQAKETAKLLGLPLTIQTIDVNFVKDSLKQLSYLIESESIMDLSIGMAVHLAAKRACEIGCKSLLLGQLADELFGGYARYLGLCRSQGWNSVQEAQLQDVLNAHQLNFERDEKAASPYTQLDLPFSYLKLVNYVLRLPTQLKINPLLGSRKTVLRMAAVKAGLPDEIASRTKKAVQYSSGIQKLVKIAST